MDKLGIVIAFALAIFFLINLVRVLPYIRDLYAKGKKPWSCDVCITFWFVLALVVLTLFAVNLRVLGSMDLLLAAPVAGAVLALLRAYPQTPGRPTLTPE